jgi:hypothetical protein
VSVVTIYVFNNGGSPGWYSAVAVCECGAALAGHICSHESFMAHDMGLVGDWKHDVYRAHLDVVHGGGEWSLVWVPTDEVQARSHAGLEAACARNAEQNRDAVTRARPPAPAPEDK